MSYIREYMDNIEKGKEIVGEKIKRQYTLILKWQQAGEVEIDEKESGKAVWFIENMCHHSKGRNDLLKLQLWQRAAVEAIFGVKGKDGKRRFTEIFLVIARKEGKSVFAAAIATYVFFIAGEYGSEIYFLATKIDQAEMVFTCFQKMIESEPELDELCRKRRSDIYMQETNSTAKKIAFNSKKADGFNPMLTVNDEVQAWRGDQGLKQYEVMLSGTGARKEPITLNICTSGYEDDGIYDELYKRSTGVLFGNSNEKRLLALIYEIDDVNKWCEKEELRKSNPNMDVSVSWEYLKDQIEIAKVSRSKKVEFLTKFCNKKQNSSVAWLDMQTVERAAGQHIGLEQFEGCYCVVGIDLSKTTDLTAISVVIEKDGVENVINKFYMPEERYKKAIEEEGVPYNAYRKQGDLELAGEHQVDYKAAVEYIIDLVRRYRIKPLMIGYDRYCAGYLVEDLKRTGLKLDDVFQGTNLTPVIRELEGKMKDGKIKIGDNNLLKAHLLNTAVKIDGEENRIKAVKLNKRAHIDGTAALLDALTVKMKHYKEIGKMLKNEKRG